MENCLFGVFSLTKHAVTEQQKYFGYGIGFDRKGTYLFGNGFGKNILIFGVDISSSLHIHNKKKDILILGDGSTQGLEHKLTAKEKFCLCLHYNGPNSYLFVNGTEMIQFKAKDSEIVATPLCLGNISK